MRENGKLLSKALAEEIRLLLPPRLQLVDEWCLTYSLEQNGVSLGTLYKQSEDYVGRRGGFVLVVKDGGGSVCARHAKLHDAVLTCCDSFSAHICPMHHSPQHRFTATANASSGAHMSSLAFQICR